MLSPVTVAQSSTFYNNNSNNNNYWVKLNHSKMLICNFV
jgi:hypothetical protein